MTTPRPRFVDVFVSGEGTIFLIHAVTERAREWVKERVSSEGYNPRFPEWVYVEHRFIENILNGMREEGLGVVLQ